MKFSRKWAMPCGETFSVPPIGDFVRGYLAASKVSVDPFARDKRWATHTNDLNPATAAEHHMDAEDFVRLLVSQGVRCDLAIFDPPYSPGQMSEIYSGVGLKRDGGGGQNGALYSRVKTALNEIMSPDGIVLSFGWNSAGMGKKHGFEQIEILLCCHGGAHNDTICLAEKRLAAAPAQTEFL